MATTSMAQAADMIPPRMETPPEVVTHSASGWYLRGDIGYGHVGHSGASYYVNDNAGTNGGEPILRGFRDEGLGDAWTLGLGIGYQISDTWRVDLTLDRFSSMDFDGVSSTNESFLCSNLSADNGIADTCEVSDTSSVTATLLMANAYADLGTYSGITPYIGAGIGGAKLHWSDLDNDVTCTGGDCINGGGANYNTLHDSTHGGKHAWRFAYALHAGASYDINCQWKVDGGYTFTHIDGGGSMFGFSEISGASGTQGYHGDIKVHEVRAGLRYKLGGCYKPPVDHNVYK